MIKLANYNQAGFTSANSVRFVREDDVPQQRKDITVSRKTAVPVKGSDQFSIPEYRFVIRKDASVDGTPTGQRLTMDLTIRVPLNSTGEELEEARAELVAFLNDPGFADAIGRQLFPVECPCE